MAKRSAFYLVNIGTSEKEAERILDEIDQIFIRLEHKYPMLRAET